MDPTSPAVFAQPVYHPWASHDAPAWLIGRVGLSFPTWRHQGNVYPGNGVSGVPVSPKDEPYAQQMWVTLWLWFVDLVLCH